MNTLMMATYWEIGRRIVESEQQRQRRVALIRQFVEDLDHVLGVDLGGAT
jgi:hypothetical protein